MVLHDRDDQGIAGEQPVALTPGGCRGHQCEIQGHGLNAQRGHQVHRLPKPCQLLDLGGMLPQMRRNPLGGQTEDVHGLQGHDPMGDVADNVRRGKAVNLLAGNPVDELQASRAVAKVGGEVVNQGVGIEEQPAALGNAGEGHGDSRMPNSSSSATRRKVSASPVQRSNP